MNEREPIWEPHQQKAIEHLEKAVAGGEAYNDDFLSGDTYKRIFDQFGNLKGKKIIDAGAGLVYLAVPHGSSYLPQLEGKGAHVIPIDIYEQAIQTWNLHRDDNSPDKVTPLRANLFKLPFKDSSIDGFVSANVLNLNWHKYGYNAHEIVPIFLTEMKRILKKGGQGVISTFGYYAYHLNDGRTVYNNNIPKEQIVSSSEIHHIASQIGFEVTDLALDPKRMEYSLRHAEKKPEVLRMEIVEPAAFLLKK